MIGHAGPSHDGHHVDMPDAMEVLADLDLGDDWDVERCADVERPTASLTASFGFVVPPSSAVELR